MSDPDAPTSRETRARTGALAVTLVLNLALFGLSRQEGVPYAALNAS